MTVYVTLRNVTLQECGNGCGYVCYYLQTYLYYWHNYALYFYGG